MQKYFGQMKNDFKYGKFLFFLIGLFSLSFFVTNLYGRDVLFNWGVNTDDPPIDGYKLYYKIGDPGASLSEYDGTDADNGSSPVFLSGVGNTSVTLYSLSDLDRYSFVLTAYRGPEESAPTTAIILNPVPSTPDTLEADIFASVSGGESPLSVDFNATGSTGNIVSYGWTFGDGATGSGSTTSHTYTSEGTYTATITATDNNGATDQASVSIVVTESQTVNTPPNAVVSSSSSVGPAPLSVQFNASSSSDSDGSIVSYSWDFGDGSGGNGSTVNHVYSAPGTYNARLTVTDNGGLSDSVSTPVLVSQPAGTSGDVNSLPIAVISASTNRGAPPLTVSFNGGKSYDTDGNIVKYAWSFGDGTVASGQNVTHAFQQIATYKVTLRVTDNEGAVSTTTTYSVRVISEEQLKEEVLAESAATNTLQAVIFLLLRDSADEGDQQTE